MNKDYLLTYLHMKGWLRSLSRLNDKTYYTSMKNLNLYYHSISE